MNVHEYQAKGLLRGFGVSVPRGTMVTSASDARKAAEALGVLAPSTARDALLRLCYDVLNRQA